MISINVRGIAQDHLPVFRSVLMLKPGGSRGKQKGALAVLSCGMAELLYFLSELEPHSREKLYFYLLRRFGQRRRKTLIYNGDGETFRT